jgi:hypothetical protein
MIFMIYKSQDDENNSILKLNSYSKWFYSWIYSKYLKIIVTKMKIGFITNKMHLKS